MFLSYCNEKAACGVGFVANRRGQATHKLLKDALHALCCVEHRGACGADKITGDGCGVMTDIPFEMFGYEKGSIAVATLFMPPENQRQRLALKVFEETFAFMGLEVLEYRDVPVDLSVLGREALQSLPAIKHAFIKRPKHCRTDESFNTLLHLAKQKTRTKEKDSGIISQFFFTSLSTTTIVYKGLVRSDCLDRFYLDLQDPAFTTRFALFHRRFSTNTKSSWDKAQPFRLIGHNGEINTVASNRAWAYSREQSLGLPVDELLTHTGISDSGSLNEMVEALKYRSSIPRVEDILALMMPPADQQNLFYKFWSRAMEPWDGPALITYSDGETIGARLDRNGFRPCRWTMTQDHFYLCSEAGSFLIDEAQIIRKGALHAGSGVTIDIRDGTIRFEDPSHSRENYDAKFDPRLQKLEFTQKNIEPSNLSKKALFHYTQEDFERVLTPMINEGKEGIGSMGDTARPAFLSTEPRSFFDYFYQDFAQVTNPPLDYLREAMVTDLVTHIGKRPNIFAPKELIPPQEGIELSSPILNLGQMAFFEKLPHHPSQSSHLCVHELDMTFVRNHGAVGFRSKIQKLCAQAIEAVEADTDILILTDKHADYDNLPMPSLLVLSAVVNALNQHGIRLETSIIVHSAEVRSTHQVACLISFGATAVCPYLALEIARFDSYKSFIDLEPVVKEKNLVKTFEQGLLKIMSKMGISVVRSYQGSKLFTPLGLGKAIIEEFFPGKKSPIGGIGIPQLVDTILHNSDAVNDNGHPIHTYQYKEHARGQVGEKHSMTSSRSKLIHDIARSKDLELTSFRVFEEYLKQSDQDAPVNIRHLLSLKESNEKLPLELIQSRADILQKFGSGAMSFGAISAEAQRDIIIAMREIGGRSNSGEGGENPYYFRDGTTATHKQIASARFGVTAEYLMSGEGFQIKIAQGAKPGEGGQLMGVKVTPDIARARHSMPNVDLISPPPLHDIYSIEDLKQLIYELKQFKPAASVSVKLVSGSTIGTIAVGVAKAGADVIHISGHDGGTGAAPLSSMKHAGLPWELGLAEVHQALVQNGLRSHITLRVDGSLQTGKDIITAAILGADEFEFGKLLLVSQGCIMARICEKNTCPTGIATHDPKFKAKYKGSPEHIVQFLQVLAEDVRRNLSEIGVPSLHDLTGRGELLEINPRFTDLIRARGLELDPLLAHTESTPSEKTSLLVDAMSPLNVKIVEDCQQVLHTGGDCTLTYPITTSDRAVLASLSGVMTQRVINARKAIMKDHTGQDTFDMDLSFPGNINLTFSGSAGQGFGVFLVSGVSVRLIGEANDSFCKSMSGGRVVVHPQDSVTFNPVENSIIGNCALYGATGGTCYVYGLAGDRFAVRNSGALAVVEGTGLHACEYMTNGKVIILGKVSHNVGAGMTGGELYLQSEYSTFVNKGYLAAVELSSENKDALRLILEDYYLETKSHRARQILDTWQESSAKFQKCIPKGLAAHAHAQTDKPQAA